MNNDDIVVRDVVRDSCYVIIVFEKFVWEFFGSYEMVDRYFDMLWNELF